MKWKILGAIASVLVVAALAWAGTTVFTGDLTVTGTCTATTGFTGDVTGNVTGDLTGDVTGAVVQEVANQGALGAAADNAGEWFMNAAGSTLWVVLGADTTYTQIVP